VKTKAPDRLAAAKRAALNALKRARRTADRAGITLSEWEGEFLGSVEGRIKTYGRPWPAPIRYANGQAERDREEGQGARHGT